ncbi:ABC transporter ATP-binding protein [Philodulcilactobacillus myokoensis]|uniref:ABC transporter ATP-binding protein n=1 Tax=Philodulcilactobacillus myokoensis TaxID=2929573 RepID=A0A9W6ET06_9LACO|nr:ABC-F family ATP-binding cassette domain-containing protein [Philodulcilactobacillus myokoensis]GLB46883.1 ABC transporter ATP-binding protein [Philodulcilactobacillus myokoensis]
MQTLRVEDLNKNYGEKSLFSNLSFIINEHDRIGLIGTNGSGKSSLLNVLSGIDHDFSGNIITSKTYSIGYLEQHPKLDENLNVLDAALAGSQDIFKTIRQYEHALGMYSKHPEDKKIERQYLNAEAKMNEDDAWNADSDVKTILTQLKITDMEQSVSTLSGGQKRRVGLAQVLIQSPDLLLLDEPTNHLDLESVEWLQKYLSNYKGALILVTHDRYFLDQVVNNIWELSFGKLYYYQGNYKDYVKEKADRIDQAQNMHHKQQRLYKQELNWMHAGAKARSTKQQARINRFYKLKNDVKQSNQHKKVDISLGQQRLGKKVIQIKHGNLSLGQHVILKDFNLLVQGGERIGISGENGAGKTSLLNVIAQRIPLDSGIITVGETVKIAYYTQQTEPIPEDKRVISYLKEVGENVTDDAGNKISVSELLERFLFPRFMHGTLIRKLSGGERRRLYLLKLLMQQPNVLLLDEPTNDLDISTLTVLEDYIQHFNGTVITVSHDRYFLDKVADRLLIFDGNGKIENHVERFTEFLAHRKQQSQHVNHGKQKHSKQNNDQKPKQKVKLTYAESIEYQKIEKDIDQLDHKKQDIEKNMAQNSNDFPKLAKLQKQLSKVQSESDQKMKRWEYLSQFTEN